MGWMGAAWGFLSGLPWVGWIKVLLANWKDLLLAILFCAFYLRGCEIDRLERRAEGFENAIGTLRTALEANARAIDECKAEAERNFAMAERQKEAGEEAAQRARDAAREADQRVAEIYDELELVRGTLDGECDDHPGPDFLDRLYRDP